jgi:hypothetical protein
MPVRRRCAVMLPAGCVCRRAASPNPPPQPPQACVATSGGRPPRGKRSSRSRQRGQPQQLATVRGGVHAVRAAAARLTLNPWMGGWVGQGRSLWQAAAIVHARRAPRRRQPARGAVMAAAAPQMSWQTARASQPHPATHAAAQRLPSPNANDPSRTAGAAPPPPPRPALAPGCRAQRRCGLPLRRRRPRPRLDGWVGWGRGLGRPPQSCMRGARPAAGS